MSQKRKIWLTIALAATVTAGLIYLRVLHERVASLEESETAEEQARTEVVAPPITTPSDVSANAVIYWVSANDSAQLEPVQVQMPLSGDPVQRCRQLIRKLIANPPSAAQRTLPPDTELLAFYLLPDGTGVADFSDNISTETPSGILSESLTVDSIVRTLAANVPSLRRLKILIHGQDAETLAGHVDLTGLLEVPPLPTTNSPAAGAAPDAATPPAAPPH
jgi:spore germination protein GerM